MLIKIDDSVIEFLETNKEILTFESNEIKSLNNLARAQMDGHHQVISSYATLKYLRNYPLIEQSCRGIYTSLLAKCTFFFSLEEFCTDYIIVTSKVENEIVRGFSGKKHIFKVSLDYFYLMDRISATTFISEDLSDCEFYEKIAKKYIQENRNRLNMKLNLDHCGGGGVNTYKELDYKINRKKIVLVVSDSDKLYPTGKVGETLAQITKVYAKYQANSIVDIYSLEVREKENLIPPSLYLLCSNGSCRDVLNMLHEIELLDKHREKLKYIDIKDGVKAKQLKNEEHLQFLKDLLIDVPNLIACSLDDIDKQKDETVLLQGIGGKIEEFERDILEDGLEKKLDDKRRLQPKPEIEKAIIQLENKIEKKTNLFNILPDYVKPEWEFLCKKVISWGCCDPIPSGIS
ncbi:hypothetical protein AB432_018555 [Brevibacillus brevis]|uniref:Uncharacterized protein n=1 Tax=Brevibacillus brevis TaxID=1393 RepID=A0A2Z4MK61_BREBE|nr:hypothetical protein [Brevibacillus brevis]AWX56926.1 hypothetical protein AB432_018555 [Brevibacillus brevis]